MKRMVLYVITAIASAVLLFLVIDGRHKMKRLGVITIARTARWESAEQGSDLYLDVRLNNQWYHTKIDGGYGVEMNAIYFVRVLSTNPKVVDELLERVPLCIAVDQVPVRGWSRIPACSPRYEH